MAFAWAQFPKNYSWSICNMLWKIMSSYYCRNEAETKERHFTDDIFKCIFLNENVWIPIKISLRFVPRGPINNIPTLVQVMAWRRPGDKPLSEPMVVRLPTHICVTRPQRDFSFSERMWPWQRLMRIIRDNVAMRLVYWNTWISDCSYIFMWEVITHPCCDFSGDISIQV